MTYLLSCYVCYLFYLKPTESSKMWKLKLLLAECLVARLTHSVIKLKRLTLGLV